MKSLIFNKIILLIVILGLIFSPLGSVFAPKVKAQYGGPATPGAAVGQALAAGAMCFVGAKLEIFLASLAEDLLGGALALVEEPVKTNSVFLEVSIATPWAVPAITWPANVAIETRKRQTSDALILSKKCIRDVVVKMIIDWLVDSTVEWIQNGGQPRFVTNWDSFARDAFNVGVGEIIAQTDLAWLCEPFGLQVRLALLPVPRYQNRITCTLDDITANIDNFYQDFRQGGWLAYEEQWYPQNNFYGATLMAISEAQAQGARRQQAAEKEAMAGRGFIGVKRCIWHNSETGECEEYEIVTPGEVVGEVVGRAVTSDWEWAANVESWTAALVNATINRLFKEGLSLMTKSIAPRRSDYGGNYDPYGGYNPNLSLEERERERIVNQYQDFGDYFNAILTSKKQSLSSEQQILVILNELKNRNCQPAVTNSDLAAAQNEITRLTNDVTYYQTAVNELNANLTSAQNIKNFTNREIALLQQNYSDFTNNYYSLISEITLISAATSTPPTTGPSYTSGVTKNLAEQEAQTKQNELSSTQSRLAICIATAP